MIINVAGAGAGKTTGLAKEIIEKYQTIHNRKKIYCISFTNNAANSIKEKLLSHFGVIPNDIIVCTIHSFLYQEFISPYYYLLYNKHYRTISNIHLPTNVVWKNNKFTELDGKDVLHVEKIPEKAKWVVVGKSTDKKSEKVTRLKIINAFMSYCRSIYVDEAQDIDAHMKDIFLTLDSFGIDIILKGDPKQDIRGHKCFRELIETKTDSVIYDPTCHRCPEHHLNITNSLIPLNEKQISEKSGGTINVVFESTYELSSFWGQRFDLKYIYQKKDRFDTHNSTVAFSQFDSLHYEIYTILSETETDLQALEIKAYNYTYAMIKWYESKIPLAKIMERLSTHTGTLSRAQYARVCDALQEKTVVPQNLLVNSIESIKGLEGESCLFILTTDLAPYLFGEKKEENKIKNALYVALTRSKDSLTILITKEVETLYGKSKITNFFDDF